VDGIGTSRSGKNPKHDQDAGFTLIEMMLATGVSLIVLAIAGGILINAMRAQDNASKVTSAGNTAQQIVRSVQAGVRNASAITVSSDPVAGTQLLLARNIGSDPASTAASCQAWYYSPVNGGAVYTKKTSPASLITVPVSGPDGIWTLLGSGITPADPVTGKVFNAPSGGRVELKFDVAAGSHPYVLINTTTYTSQTASVSSPCF
jgi:prepilin-type N-terminal cleavage/methylation domain-containing protein